MLSERALWIRLLCLLSRTKHSLDVRKKEGGVINGRKYLKGIFATHKKLLKPYVDTLSAQLKSKEMPVRARRFSNCDRLTEVDGAQILRELLPLSNGTIPLTTILPSSSSLGDPSTFSIPRPLPPPFYYSSESNMTNGENQSGIWSFGATPIQEYSRGDAEDDSSVDDEDEDAEVGFYLTSKQQYRDEEEIERWILENDDRPLKRRRMLLDQRPALTKEKETVSLVDRVRNFVGSFIPGLT
ncbi:hypothetical protein BDB00DRAFT_171638 [Zychaea mexicana]|uniref:uncharacterized protein n=1 Tax=Zychaea mexicana TaxID=64656 RepID=UPI0022FEFB30|nr:uncharacterized protein BDB00DRAFT_171638 [Zychaea mexicana]KAI9480229.1 hypothetical protein BDB00DRAFT_171638 [Zychaea mexicana]